MALNLALQPGAELGVLLGTGLGVVLADRHLVAQGVEERAVALGLLDGGAGPGGQAGVAQLVGHVRDADAVGVHSPPPRG